MEPSESPAGEELYGSSEFGRPWAGASLAVLATHSVQFEDALGMRVYGCP